MFKFVACPSVSSQTSGNKKHVCKAAEIGENIVFVETLDENPPEMIFLGKTFGTSPFTKVRCGFGKSALQFRKSALQFGEKS